VKNVKNQNAELVGKVDPIYAGDIGIRSTTVRTGPIPPTPYPHLSYFYVLLQTRIPFGYADDTVSLDGDFQSQERSGSMPRVLGMIERNPTGNTIRE
jgi:hypothetical protein